MYFCDDDFMEKLRNVFIHVHICNFLCACLTFSAEALLEQTFGSNFLQEVRAQNLIGVCTPVAQPQAMAASYHSCQGSISL